MKNHNFIGKTRYFFVVLMLVAITVSSAMVPEYATAKTHTKKELKQEVKQLTSKIKMNNRKMRAQTKGLTEIFGSIVSYNPFIIKDFVGNYYYVTNPSVLASRFLLSDVYAKRSSNYKTFYLSNEGYVNCQVIKAKKINYSYANKSKKYRQKRKKCQKTLKNRIVFSYWKAIYPKGSKNELDYYWRYSNAYSQKIKWKSNHPSIARVDKKGYITARKVGSAVITAKSSISGKKAKLRIQVKNPYVKFDKSVYNFSYDSIKDRTERLSYDALTVDETYKVAISDKSIVRSAIVKNNGTIKITTTGKSGQTKITLRAKNGLYSICTVNVNTVIPTPEPTQQPTPEPTVEPTPEPTVEPTPKSTSRYDDGDYDDDYYDDYYYND